MVVIPAESIPMSMETLRALRVEPFNRYNISKYLKDLQSMQDACGLPDSAMLPLISKYQITRDIREEILTLTKGCTSWPEQKKRLYDAYWIWDREVVLSPEEELEILVHHTFAETIDELRTLVWNYNYSIIKLGQENTRPASEFYQKLIWRWVKKLERRYGVTEQWAEKHTWAELFPKLTTVIREEADKSLYDDKVLGRIKPRTDFIRQFQPQIQQPTSSFPLGGPSYSWTDHCNHDVDHRISKPVEVVEPAYSNDKTSQHLNLSEDSFHKDYMEMLKRIEGWSVRITQEVQDQQRRLRSLSYDRRQG